MMRIVFLATSLVLVTAPSVGAQLPTDIAGSRVRVVLADSLRQQWAPSTQWLRGTVTGVAPDRLYLRLPNTEASVPIRRDAIRRLDRSLGVPNRPESALRGAVAGAFWGAIFLGLVRAADEPWGSSRAFWDEVGEGAAVGAGIGFVMGTIFPTERWRRVRLR
jgi:hypothetical protein